MELTEQEKKELRAFENRNQAIQNLLDKLVLSQEALNSEKNDFFMKVRERCQIPDTAHLHINSQTGKMETQEAKPQH